MVARGLAGQGRGHREQVDSGWLIGGRYRLHDRLGSGGMSVVWEARDEVLDRDVAVKVLAPALAEDPELLRRIHAEARAAAGLRHPNVVAVYDYGETDDRGRLVPYIVMELVTGRSMTELLTGGPLPWRLAVLIGAQVAAALASAHAHGIVHRDVKPGNVMVTAAGVKLVDFGISATIGDADMAEGQLLGTPAYLAPERLDGGHVRPATDVYALGLLLFLGLAGGFRGRRPPPRRCSRRTGTANRPRCRTFRTCHRRRPSSATIASPSGRTTGPPRRPRPRRSAPSPVCRLPRCCWRVLNRSGGGHDDGRRDPRDHHPTGIGPPPDRRIRRRHGCRARRGRARGMGWASPRPDSVEGGRPRPSGSRSRAPSNTPSAAP
jgi:serine/threonine protein kinase